jgi:hypothetical protein
VSDDKDTRVPGVVAAQRLVASTTTS